MEKCKQLDFLTSKQIIFHRGPIWVMCVLIFIQKKDLFMLPVSWIIMEIDSELVRQFCWWSRSSQWSFQCCFKISFELLLEQNWLEQNETKHSDTSYVKVERRKLVLNSNSVCSNIRLSKITVILTRIASDTWEGYPRSPPFFRSQTDQGAGMAQSGKCPTRSQLRF